MENESSFSLIVGAMLSHRANILLCHGVKVGRLNSAIESL